MTTMREQRDGIVSAVSLSVGALTITAQPDPPGVVSPLLAWPIWDSSEPTTACATVTTWRVLVALPTADATTWDDATDALVLAVTEALFTLGRVQRVEPVTWMGQDTVGFPCLSFTLAI